MVLSSKSLAGPGYIILNAIRVMNVIGFLAVITASVVMLVKTTTASKFFFFDALSHVITAITSTFLLVSELSVFPQYFARNWPLLSPTHGFVTLAMAMIILGLNILGNLNKQATTQQALGLPFWRIVIGSGILVFILGFINLIASYIFRDCRQGITARQVRAHGAVAAHHTPISRSTISNPIHSSSSTPITPQKKSLNALRLVTRENRSSTLPSYHSTTTSPLSTKSETTANHNHNHITVDKQQQLSPSSKYSRATICTKKKLFGNFGHGRRESLAPPLPLNISAPLNVNPQFAHLVNVQRPDSALHPARGTGESEAFRWRV